MVKDFLRERIVVVKTLAGGFIYSRCGISAIQVTDTLQITVLTLTISERWMVALRAQSCDPKEVELRRVG